MTTKDIVFATVPYTDTTAPLMAPAILKSIANKANYTAYTVDLNIKAVNFIDKSLYKNQYIDFFHNGVVVPEIKEELFELFQQFTSELLKFQPKIIGLSLFTYTCRTATTYLCFMIKKLSPNTKIILGGSGLTNHLIGPSKFGDNLIQRTLIDFYIRGDGETALYNYLTTQSTEQPGINNNNWHQLSNEELLALPTPNYDDYNFNEYESSVAIPMLGSRGCVRNCSFCDIHTHWTKFSWRSGEHIFNEMVELHHKHGSRKFLFYDSLINGNLKEYRILMKLIAEWNLKHGPEKAFCWGSYFIFRPVKNFTEEDWRLTADGGARQLAVGIESLSDASRFHMNKKFTNEDIEFSIEMAVKYNITLMLLFIVGYVTDTEEDTDFAVKWFKDHIKYKDNLIINLGTPLGIVDGSPLKDQFNELGLIRTGTDDHSWANPANDNTPANRVRWFNKVNDTVIQLGYNHITGTDNRYILERMMTKQ